MKWLLFTSQLPTFPSSLRVMVWRRMKSAGAASLQNGVWVLPHTKEQEKLVEELLSYLREQGAHGQSFSATTVNDYVEKDLLQRFKGLRDEEYAELIEGCQRLLAELAKETKKKKFTFAELEENEDDVRKLQSWLFRIQARDLVGGERTNEAIQLVEDSKKVLAEFAKDVYSQEKVLSKNKSSK